MLKIGITGSLSSGKSTVSKFISAGKYPIYNADKEVAKLYKDIKFILKVKKLFKLKSTKKIKAEVKKLIIYNKINLKKIEKLIHPLVRKRMILFMKKNRQKKILIFEIPLLIESKMKKFFNITIFVKSNKSVRKKRYFLKNKGKKLFDFLDNAQIKQNIKSKLCDYVVNNNKSLNLLNKKIKYIMNNYA
jgi:dephospho-CoA kinase